MATNAPHLSGFPTRTLMPQDLPQPRSRWPQFSLWFLLFVIPTVAGIVLGAYSAVAAQDKRFRDLIAEHALVIQECSEAEARHKSLVRIEQAYEEMIAEWNSPDAILIEIRTTNPTVKWARRDPVYFFLQASDQQLDELVDLLAENFPDSHPAIQARILECVKSFPEYVVAERLKGLREKVRRFVEPLQFDSDERIQQLAAETLFAFNSPSPLREEE